MLFQLVHLQKPRLPEKPLAARHHVCRQKQIRRGVSHDACTQAAGHHQKGADHQRPDHGRQPPVAVGDAEGCRNSKKWNPGPRADGDPFEIGRNDGAPEKIAPE